MNKQQEFIKLLLKVENHFKKNNKRLAGEGWKHPWQTLIATIMSAQTKDETTIPVAENLFKKYKTLTDLANAKHEDVKEIIKSVNYNNTKTKHVIDAARHLILYHDAKTPSNMQDLLKIPGVGRKTANLVLAECFTKDAICVDTHVHKISNMFEFVNTKTPNETEIALMQLVPKKYWSRINRAFVLWGKESSRYDKDVLISHLNK